MTSDLHSGSSCLQFSGEGQAICFGLSPKPCISRYTASYNGLAQTNSVVLPIHQVRITVYELQGQGER